MLKGFFKWLKSLKIFNSKKLKKLYIEQSELLDKNDFESVCKYKFNRQRIGFLEDVLELNVERIV